MSAVAITVLVCLRSSAAAEDRDARHTGPSGCLSRSEELDSLDKFMFVKEESTLWIRCCLSMLGMLHLRPLKLHFQANPGSGEAFVAERYAHH